MIAPRFAGIELGGTKTIAVLAMDNRIIDRLTVKTGAPASTFPAVREQLFQWHADSPLAAVGIASFGPVCLHESSPQFGCTLATPKSGWSNIDIVGGMTSGLTLPVRIDTDVNGAALAEYRWGAGRGTDSLCYLTIGTGVGGGLIVNGHPIHGALHPEIGHLRLRRSDGDTFLGHCPFHGDCIEGLVSGPALAARFGCSPDGIDDDHPEWNHVATDIANLVGALLLTVSAQKILIGGGVTRGRSFLLAMVRQRVAEALGSYLPFAAGAELEGRILRPELGDDAGPLGSIALASIRY